MSSSDLKLAIEPWYKHRIVWLMLGLPLVVVVASFITLYLAIKTDDGVVDDDYYKQGLAINQDLARDDKAKALGLSAQLQFSGTTANLKLSALTPASLVGVPIQLLVQNVGVKTKDQVVALVPTGNGMWRGQLQQPLMAGHWQIHLEAQDWRLLQTVKGDVTVPIVFSAK
ncbi:hypothetical protein DTO96_100983 [Ephemeroptericola cinctiostellae]|uniref:FixH n=1 Tax=Ephemeroptericola cinctiostellae TaxID=2268024 RepID=A0A345DA69_9BURK|nr:FixH family protein [Ephemeroptericola cinctiostellae]AXF85257.1 hypothetical protein DTO96_100983 [Ephemeroptericola cinctiostellae]